MWKTTYRVDISYLGGKTSRCFNANKIKHEYFTKPQETVTMFADGIFDDIKYDTVSFNA